MSGLLLPLIVFSGVILVVGMFFAHRLIMAHLDAADAERERQHALQEKREDRDHEILYGEDCDIDRELEKERR